MKKTNTTKTTVDAIEKPVPVAALDWEFLRTHQTRPMSRDEVVAALAELRNLQGLTFTQNAKAYYGAAVACGSTRICTIWFKHDAWRLCLSPRALETWKSYITVDLETRTAWKPEGRGSAKLMECPNEWSLTAEEVTAFLKAINDVLPSEEPAAEEPKAE